MRDNEIKIITRSNIKTKLNTTDNGVVKIAPTIFTIINDSIDIEIET